MEPPWPEGYVPPIKSVMTPFPYSIHPRDSLARAATMMAEHEIRHLPVEDDGDLVGVVSERDLRTLRLSRPAINHDRERTVADVMHRPYCVDLETPLDVILAEMADEVIGCALVLRHDKLAGIFTVVDACRLFAQHLGHEPPEEGAVA